MSKALLAKKDYQNLRDDVDQEVFIEHAFKCTQVLGKVAKNLSPGSNRELLCGTFTPKDLKTKSYLIPKSKSKNPENQAEANK